MDDVVVGSAVHSGGEQARADACVYLIQVSSLLASALTTKAAIFFAGV